LLQMPGYVQYVVAYLICPLCANNLAAQTMHSILLPGQSQNSNVSTSRS
jgi:hypothetical protein